jgi:hypothetical protein
MADRGDGVKSANFDTPVLRNALSRIQVRTLGDNTQYIDIGSATPGAAFEPDLFYLQPNAVKGAAISKEFTDDLWKFICDDSDTPGIMWGFESVSQRSSMSMETLAGPYVSHARAERVMHRQGLGLVNRMILQMINAKGLTPEAKKRNAKMVTDEMLELDPRIKWAKLMPRDRMEKVQEMVQRKSVNLVSTPNAVTQLSEGEDPDEEVKEIQAEIAEQRAFQQQQMDQQHQMQLETQRQNLQMKLQAQRSGAKKANPRQEVRQ